jgi:hypothetical protein
MPEWERLNSVFSKESSVKIKSCCSHFISWWSDVDLQSLAKEVKEKQFSRNIHLRGKKMIK